MMTSRQGFILQEIEFDFRKYRGIENYFMFPFTTMNSKH